MSRSGLLTVLLVSMAVLLCDAEPAAAFCIENRADEALTFVVDIDGRGSNAPYVRTLAPGESGCCDWQRYDCNASGKKDGTLKFSVSRIVGNKEWVCFGDFEASDEFYFEAHARSSKCDWGLTTNRSGLQLWTHFKDRLAKLVDWLIATWQS